MSRIWKVALLAALVVSIPAAASATTVTVDATYNRQRSCDQQCQIYDIRVVETVADVPGVPGPIPPLVEGTGLYDSCHGEYADITAPVLCQVGDQLPTDASAHVQVDLP